MSKDKIEFGAYQAIVNCLAVRPEDRVCIVSDRETKHIADAFVRQSLKITNKVKLFIKEDFGPRPDDGSQPLHLPQEIADDLKMSQVSIYCAQKKTGELASFRSPLLHIVDEFKIRHAHMPSVNDVIMATGMNADYAKIQEINKKVFARVKHAKEIRVTTDLGTDFVVTFHPDWKWINSDGHISSGHWCNLPDGEVFTCAHSAEGIVIIDGVLGDHLAAKYGVVDQTPVTLTVEKGRIKKVECVNAEIVHDINEYMKQDENAHRLAEFAIGTNIALKQLVGVMVQDEKFPGVHIALGDGYPDKTGSSWRSSAHMDMIITKTTIAVDGQRIMEKGKFLL